ncbi:MAG: hypothetical protein K5931_06495 [Lachnospiraceae bacterium]|nr:hypothetical protein [Lachnospiraceae bacterium]
MFEIFSSMFASRSVKELMNGLRETVRLSDQQIVKIIFDSDVAAEELNDSEFEKFEDRMDYYENKKEKKELNLQEFLDRVYNLVDEFEEIAPYKNMTDDTSLYDRAAKERINEEEANKICSAGIVFMNKLLSTPSLIQNAPDSEHLIINVYVYYKFIVGMLVRNNIIGETDAGLAFKKFESYLIKEQLQAIRNPVIEINSALSLLSNLAAHKCIRDRGLLDIRLTATLFCEIFLQLSIDFNNPENFRNVQQVATYVFELQKEITGGRVYEQLKTKQLTQV